MHLYGYAVIISVRVKLVAPLRDLRVALMELRNDPSVIPKGAQQYVETLLFIPAGAYGAPDLYGVRVFGEHDERAVLVHYGQDLRDQKEDVVETGPKDRLIYKLQDLGYQPLGEFPVSEWRFRWEEFFITVIKYGDLGSFIVIYREFPGDDTDLFARKQKKAFSFLMRFGITVKDLLPYDVRGIVVMMALQAAQGGGSPKE